MTGGFELVGKLKIGNGNAFIVLKYILYGDVINCSGFISCYNLSHCRLKMSMNGKNM